jgi:4-aminobutyrate aminotransferase-like enzyme
LKARGVLISTDGPNDDVLKIKPPLVISAADCDFFLEALCDVL